MKNATLRFVFDGESMKEMMYVDGFYNQEKNGNLESNLLPITRKIDWGNVGAHVGITLIQVGVMMMVMPYIFTFTTSLVHAFISNLNLTPIMPLTKMIVPKPICL